MGIAMEFRGVAMGDDMGIGGVALGIAMGLRGVAMANAVGLDLGVAVGLAGVWGQIRRNTTGSSNGSGGTGKARQNGMTFVRIRMDRSGCGTGRGIHR